LFVGIALLTASLAACSSSSKVTGNDEFGVEGCNPDDCLVVDVAVSSEKIDLLSELAKDFNASSTTTGDKRIVVAPKTKASGGAASLLATGWDEQVEGPRPVVWTPASSVWGAVLDQRLTEQGKATMAGTGTPFMSTPLVVAMPKPMAEALGWPDTPIGYADILARTRDPQGWAALGHPEWGPFRLGKTNPNYSTSGLGALIGQNYAAAGKTSDLTSEDLGRTDVVDFNKGIESSVVHYGDTTLTFLNNWYNADRRGDPYSYASAVAVEEKSVIDYNQGNPDGKLDPGEQPRPPRVPLVAIYPKEGTVFSDNPLYILDADWVSPEERTAAQAFIDFTLRPENQAKTLRYNFRPGNPQVAIEAPITAANGVNPNEPQTTLQVPTPAVSVALLDAWALQRKAARVMLVVDVSGSMSEPADPAEANGDTKLDLAVRAAIESLGQFRDDDQVGLRQFSTELGGLRTDTFVDLVPVGPMATQGEALRAKLSELRPLRGTPLYSVTRDSMQKMLDELDSTRINAVVLLTDGRNQDGDDLPDDTQLTDTLRFVQDATQGETGKPVRLFTIGYGADADSNVLKQLATASDGAFYSAADPKSINKVFTQVISNF
jgi:Ca-activated chloride channel family protein